MTHDEIQGENVSWRATAYAMGGLLVVLVSVVTGLMIQQVSVNADQNTRLALLEKQAVLNRNDIDKIAPAIDRINATLAQISYEHQQMERRK